MDTPTHNCPRSDFIMEDVPADPPQSFVTITGRPAGPDREYFGPQYELPGKKMKFVSCKACGAGPICSQPKSRRHHLSVCDSLAPELRAVFAAPAMKAEADGAPVLDSESAAVALFGAAPVDPLLQSPDGLPSADQSVLLDAVAAPAKKAKKGGKPAPTALLKFKSSLSEFVLSSGVPAAAMRTAPFKAMISHLQPGFDAHLPTDQEIRCAAVLCAGCVTLLSACDIPFCGVCPSELQQLCLWTT